YSSSALIPAAFAFILGSFRRVGSSLRPRNRLARHPFLALFAFSLMLGGILVFAFQNSRHRDARW
ncbi:MAG: hypothetical protein ABH877_01725, partial [bacterium]